MLTLDDMERDGLAAGCTAMALFMLAGWLLATLIIWGYTYTTRDPNDVSEYANRQDRTTHATTRP